MSPRKRAPKFRNRILATLSPADLALLQPHLQPLALERGKKLEIANKKIENIYFPEHGMASVVGGPGKASREVEIGIVGNEGMTGLPVVFGDNRALHHTFIQLAGDGHRLPVAALRNALESSTLQSLLLKYAQAFMAQATHTSIANARATLEQRLARWVLMAQDRVQSDSLPLTHEFLSLMLAVRRAGVTEALHELSRRGLIKHDRGTIAVIDRDALIECSNGFYGIPESEYERLLA